MVLNKKLLYIWGVLLGSAAILAVCFGLVGMIGAGGAKTVSFDKAAAAIDDMTSLCCGSAERTETVSLAGTPFDTDFVPQEPAYVERFRDYDGEKARYVPVMMYHFFYDADYESPTKGTNSHSIQSVRRQLQFLWENGYVTLTMDELYEWLNGEIELPRRCIVLTSDDGQDNFFELLQPELHKYGFVATSFVITSYRKHIPEKLLLPNVELHSHTHNMHKGMVTSGGVPDNRGMMQGVSVEEGVKDLKKSVEILGGSQYFAYPYGTYGGNSKKILREAGFRLAFTTKYGMVHRGDDPLQLSRVRVSGSMSVNEFKAAIGFQA